MPNYKYMRMAAQLEEDIRSHALAPGKKIPTEDELAVQYGMSRNTVRQAVQTLVNQGILVKIQGSGTFVSERRKPARASGRGAERSRCIGVVMNQVNSYIFPSMLMGIGDYLLEHDYHMLIRMTFNEIAAEERVLAELLDAGVAGFIIEPARSGLPTVNRHLYQKIKERHPCVVIHASMPEFGFASIDNSNIEGFGNAVDHLVAKGHVDIALLSKSDEQSGANRFLGYTTGLRRNGLTVRENRVLWYTDEDVEDMFSDANAHRVLKTVRDCTATMCFNDELARKFLIFLDRHGVAVPEKMSVIGFDDMQQGQITVPLTTIAHPKEKMGRAAAQAILALIGDPEANVSHYFEPKLIERGTVHDRSAEATPPLP